MPNCAAEPPSIVLTAGYDRAPQAIALCQLLRRDGVAVRGILVVTPLSLGRVRAVVKSGGLGALRAAARKAIGRRPAAASPLADYFAANEIEMTDLRSLARRHDIPYLRVSGLDRPRALDFLRSSKADGAIYCGGGMLRQPFIAAAGGRVLNGHAGPLPEIRGLNAAEWSILTGRPLEVTIHYIDSGVDTGPVLAARPFAAEKGDGVDQLRERSLVAAIEGLRAAVPALAEPMPERRADAAAFPQYFSVAPALRPLLERRLAERAR